MRRNSRLVSRRPSPYCVSEKLGHLFQLCVARMWLSPYCLPNILISVPLSPGFSTSFPTRIIDQDQSDIGVLELCFVPSSVPNSSTTSSCPAQVPHYKSALFFQPSSAVVRQSLQYLLPRLLLGLLLLTPPILSSYMRFSRHFTPRVSGWARYPQKATAYFTPSFSSCKVEFYLLSIAPSIMPRSGRHYATLCSRPINSRTISRHNSRTTPNLCMIAHSMITFLE